MAEASKTIEMDVSREELWKVIADYASYPQFVEGAQKVKILSREKTPKGEKVRVEYGISLLSKDITYTLDHYEEGPAGMRWELVDSNILKRNSGQWSLKALGTGQTEVTYSLALDFKIYVPGMILNGLVKSQLPKMLEGFEKRTLEVMSGKN